MVNEVLKEGERKMGRYKKYTYKHLTDEMKSKLDALILEKGKEKAYDTILYNMFVEGIAEVQNKPYAFDVVERTNNGDPIYRWERELRRNALVWGGNNMPLEQEMLFYVDAHRFYNDYNSKSIAEICIENLFK